SNSQFDPAVVDAFLKTYDKLTALQTTSAKSVRFQAALQTNGTQYWGKYQNNAESMGSVNLIVVENGSAELNLIACWMRTAGMNVRSCANYSEAMQQVRENCPQVVITNWGNMV